MYEMSPVVTLIHMSVYEQVKRETLFIRRKLLLIFYDVTIK